MSDQPNIAGSVPQPRSNLAVRLGTVGVLGPLVLILLFWGPVWGWAAFIGLSAAMSARELLGMTHPRDGLSRWVGSALTLLLAYASYNALGDPRLFFTVVIVVIVTSALLPLFRLGELPTAALRTFGGMSAPFYVAVLLMTLAMLRRDQGELGPRFVFLTLTIAWMGDTGGYTLGRTIGKTPLYPAVSPKKTREGLLGSVLFSTAVSVIASLTYLSGQLRTLDAALLGFAGALLGQSGDLVESLIKRSTGVKDSGSLLPGHGGLLDRIDALLVVSPLVYLYTLWLA